MLTYPLHPLDLPPRRSPSLKTWFTPCLSHRPHTLTPQKKFQHSRGLFDPSKRKLTHLWFKCQEILVFISVFFGKMFIEKIVDKLLLLIWNQKIFSKGVKMSVWNIFCILWHLHAKLWLILDTKAKNYIPNAH